MSIVGDEMAEIRLGRAEVEKGRLPKVCMVCGARSSVKRKRVFKWSQPWTMLVGGLILASIMAKRMTVQAPFCQEHRNHWLMRTLVSIFGFIGVVVVSGALLFVAAVKSGARGQDEKLMLIALGFGGVLFVVWLLAVIVLQQSCVRMKEVAENSITLIGVNKSFISALRDLRDERRAGRTTSSQPARRRSRADEVDDSDDDEDD